MEMRNTSTTNPTPDCTKSTVPHERAPHYGTTGLKNVGSLLLDSVGLLPEFLALRDDRPEKRGLAAPRQRRIAAGVSRVHHLHVHHRDPLLQRTSPDFQAL